MADRCEPPVPSARLVVDYTLPPDEVRVPPLLFDAMQRRLIKEEGFIVVPFYEQVEGLVRAARKMAEASTIGEFTDGMQEARVALAPFKDIT